MYTTVIKNYETKSKMYLRNKGTFKYKYTMLNNYV